MKRAANLYHKLVLLEVFCILGRDTAANFEQDSALRLKEPCYTAFDTTEL